jgi:hypothetical protein
MSLRRRLVLLSATAVALAVIAAAAVSYAVVRNELRDQIDGQLTAQARLAAGRDPFGGFGGGNPPPNAIQSSSPSAAGGQIPSLSSRRGGPAGYAP